MSSIQRRGLIAMATFSWLSTLRGKAKAQTKTFGSVSELRDHVMAALRRRADVKSVVADPADSAKFTVIAGDQTSTGDVTNLFGYLRSYPEQGIETPVGRFINSLFEGKTNAVGDDSIVAVIRTRDYVDQARSGGLDVLHEPLVADLMVVYMSDRPDSMSPIGLEDMPGKNLAAVKKLALDNVRRWLPKVVSDDDLGDGVLYYVEDNTLLSTTLILFDEFWASIAPRFPGDALIALPRRDQLFVFEDSSPTARSRARRLIQLTFEDNFNLLSPNLYARRNGKIVQVADA